MFKNRRRIVLVVIAIILIAIVGGSIFYLTPLPPMAQAVAALEDTTSVDVETEKWLTFVPTSNYDTGFIFYPGALVDPRAYAPMAEALASEGIYAVIMPMPLNLAVIAPNSADEPIATVTGIQHWFIGGHSLGGAMAARYADEHPTAIEGLIFLAAYPDVSNDLSDTSLPVLSISGSLDGLATPDKIGNSHALLPANAEFLEIEGGNHAQFGWYGNQRGDNAATISRDEQQQIMIDAILAFIREVRSVN